MIEYTRLITDAEQKILENDLLDVKDWINKAIEGKINNCFKRAASQYDQLASAEALETVPAKKEKKVEELFKHPKYKSRVQRDAEIRR